MILSVLVLFQVSTTVDGSLMWTLLARPLGVHIRGTLLYMFSIHQNKILLLVTIGVSMLDFTVRLTNIYCIVLRCQAQIR